MSDILLRSASEADAALLRDLARACPPLDLHTPYTYWVNARYFGDLAVIAEEGGLPIGFAMAVLRGQTLLLWQIGILPPARGRGISGTLIDQVERHAHQHGVTTIEVSIAPENAASNAAVRSWARRRSLEVEHIGDVKLTDDTDPGFMEFEHIFRIRL
jgi:L-2,4-diaminobutyric acid acetyltransferase